jgi:hypothetical protein
VWSKYGFEESLIFKDIEVNLTAKKQQKLGMASIFVSENHSN